MMKCMRNERGVALVTALLLTTLALAIIAAVLYIVTQGIQVSAASKRYKSALEASHGGMEVFTKDLIPQIFSGTASSQVATAFSTSISSLSFGPYSSCLKQKLNNTTAQWGTAVCGPNARVIDPKSNFDATFTLKGLPGQGNYKAYAQIIDTVKGNSDKSGFDNNSLLGGSGVTGTSSGISPMHIPALYTIEVQGENETNPLEKAKLSVLYTY